MTSKVYDVIILWAWPAGLFCASKISNNNSVLIINKSNTPAQKLLLSAKWRWNLSNRLINPENDYVTDQQQFIANAFKKYWVKDFISFVENQGFELKEEDNWRLLLKSGKVLQFQERLIQIVKNNWVEIKNKIEFKSINKNGDVFEIETSEWKYKSKSFVVATWWPSFPELWATSVAINIAKIFNLEYINFYPALVWLETDKDFSCLSWSSVIGDLYLLKWNNVVYSSKWPILFTHRWISWPAVFNTSLFIRSFSDEYSVKINVSSTEITKRLLNFLWFHKNSLNSYKITTKIVNIRWLDEAKVCWWGVCTNNLTDNFECKNINWLYFIGECTDVTWKTWWFNLQWCRTSGAICSMAINNKK